MALDWKNVADLKDPIQTTVNDLVLSGHGKLDLANGETTVPENIECVFLVPPGAAIMDSTGQALESMTKIVKLGIKNPDSDVLITNTPVRYSAGKKAPNYTLYPPEGLVLGSDGPRLIVVNEARTLHELWELIKPLRTEGKTLRCFWSACTSISGGEKHRLYYK